MEHFVVSARKYRPQTFDTVVDQGNIVTTLKNAILRQQLSHAYLFCGPRGVGKTTCARIFAKTINCSRLGPDMEACGQCESCLSFAEGRSYCIHELDAASNNSVDDIRELIDKVRIPPQVGRYSVYIIDEVHMLSQSAFNAFLKTLEEPPAYAIFILATTEKHKVLPTILSRCQTFDFNRISRKGIVDYLARVAEKEAVSVGREALHVIAQRADGAMRDALTLLDQCIAICGKEITYSQAIANLNVLDYEYYFRFCRMALEGAYDQMLVLFDEVLSKGFNALHFIGGLSNHFRNLLVCKNPQSLPLLEAGEEVGEKYKEQAQQCDTAFIVNALQICATAEANYKTANNPRLHIELALIKLSRLNREMRAATSAPGKSAAVPAAPAFAPAAASAPGGSAPASVTAAASAPAPGGSAPASAPTAVPPASGGPVPVAAPTAVPALGSTPASAPTSTPTSAPAPVPAPASAPAPLSQETRPLKGLSITEIIRNKGRKGPEAKTQSAAQNLQEAFTQEQLEQAWGELIEKQQSKPRLAFTLKANKPLLKDNYLIIFNVDNNLQQQWIQKHCQESMLVFLQERLRNSQIKMQIQVAPEPEENEESPRLYSNLDKANYLIRNHPEVKDLQESLHLDIS